MTPLPELIGKPVMDSRAQTREKSTRHPVMPMWQPQLSLIERTSDVGSELL